MSTSSTADERDQVQLLYPTDPNAYKILEEISGGGSGAKVHKAICVHSPWKTSLVAIKIIDLEQSPADFHSPRRESITVSLHSHPNVVLATHCSFLVQHYLWVVMPYVMATAPLQSIISSYFSDGLSEQCIAIILKETLKGLYYLHDNGRSHTDIKADNILIDTDKGSVKLADYGISVSIYDLINHIDRSSSLCSSSRMRLNDVSGTPYWMAPEVIQHSETGYSFRADIWSFGITALELAHGRPPLSHLPPSKSLIMKIKKRFGFSDYDDEKHKKGFKSKNFSEGFKDMVASCLDQDPSKRPSADQLLEYSFFKNCEGLDILFKSILNVEERFKATKNLHDGTSSQITAGTDIEEEEEGTTSAAPCEQRISGWKFNEDGFVLDPVFHTESEDDEVAKLVRFGGETIIPDSNIIFNKSSGGSGDFSEGHHTGANMCGLERIVEDIEALESSLDEQRKRVVSLSVQLEGEADVEEQMVQRIKNLMEELDLEKEKKLE